MSPGSRKIAGTKVRILIVDDHPIVCEGLAQLINGEPDLDVCGTADSAGDALKAVGTLHPDLVIVDAALKESSGLELVKDLKIRHPDLPVLALSMHEETFYAERFIRAGARGYVMKEEATETVLGAIRRVLAGEVYLSERMTSRLLRRLSDPRQGKLSSPVGVLSDRELEVFRLIGQGRTTRQIAEQLHLSVKTVETYRANIKDKLKLASGNELVQYAVRWTQGNQGI